MTDLLDEAINRLRELPEAEQDLAAEIMFAVADRYRPRFTLTPEQVEEVRFTQEGLRNGTVRVLSEEETEAMWRRLGA